VHACYESQFSRHGPLSTMFTEPREKQQRTVPLPQASSAVCDADDAGSLRASYSAAGEAAAGAGDFDRGGRVGGVSSSGGGGSSVTAFHVPNARPDGAELGGAGDSDARSSAAAIGSDVPLRPLLCEAVEEDVFRRIGPPLLLLFATANRDRDAAFQRQLWLMRDAQPYHLGIAAPRESTPVSSPQQPEVLPLNPPAISEIFPTDADGVCEAERAGLIVVGASPAFDAEAGLRMLELHLNGGGSSGPGNGHSGAGAGRPVDDGALSAASSHGSRRLVSASLATSSFLMSAVHRSDQSSEVTAFSNRSDRPVSDSTPPTANLFPPTAGLPALSTPPAMNAQSPFASPIARTASGSVSSPSLLTAALRDTRSADSRYAHTAEAGLATPTAESAAVLRRQELVSLQRKTPSQSGAAAAMMASARGMSVSCAEDFFAASADDAAGRPVRSLSFAGSDAFAASVANADGAGVLARSVALPHASLLSASLAASQSFLAANASATQLGSIARMARKQPLSALPELESENGDAGARLLDFGAAAAAASLTPPSAPSSASRPSSIIVGFTVGAASVSPSKPTAARRIGGGAADRLNSPRSTLDDCDPRVIDRLSAIESRAGGSAARPAPSGMSPSSPRLSQSQTAYSSVSAARQITAAAPLSSARAVPAPAPATADAAAPSNGSMRRFAASPSSPSKYGRQPYAQSFTGSSPLSSHRGSPRGIGGGGSPLISPSGGSSSVRRSGHLHTDTASHSGTSHSNSGSFRPRPTPPRDLFSSQYADCINELRQLCSLDEHLPLAHSSTGGVGVATPRGKTRHLLSILQRLSAASEQGERAMGADDLCSVLSYAILIAGVSHAHGTSNAQSPFALTTQVRGVDAHTSPVHVSCRLHAHCLNLFLSLPFSSRSSSSS
jgi:hypothetical protein